MYPELHCNVPVLAATALGPDRAQAALEVPEGTGAGSVLDLATEGFDVIQMLTILPFPPSTPDAGNKRQPLLPGDPGTARLAYRSAIGIGLQPRSHPTAEPEIVLLTLENSSQNHFPFSERGG